MQAVTDATFNNMVLMSEKLVLVFFLGHVERPVPPGGARPPANRQ